MPGAVRPRVVFDINVYLDYIAGSHGSLLLPAAAEMPTEVAAADALALVFDDRCALFASPHVLRNINRVMITMGHSEQTRRKYIEFIADLCDTSGGAIVEPVLRDYGIGDHEDNNILALAKDPSANADVIVSSDHHLTDLGPAWNGRLIVRPRGFVSHLLRASVPQSPPPATTHRQTSSRRPAQVATPPKRVSDAFPELRGVHLDRYGLAEPDVLPASRDIGREL